MCKWQGRILEKETQEPENIGTKAFPSSIVGVIFYCREFFFLCIYGCKLLIYNNEVKD
jgi:hypothetical protein